MRELQLNEIAAYLPYELEVEPTDGWASPMVSIVAGMVGLLTDDTDNIDYFDLKDIKPILRPLSDLMPYENGELDGMGETNDYILIRLVDNTDQHCDAYDEWRDSYFDNPIPARILQAPYEVFQELVKEHYDVFDLISSGLAIDINTISHA